MDEKRLLNTKEVARLLHVNEKLVYGLIADKGLPATKVTGKWLFPRHLVHQWIQEQTVNLPRDPKALPPYHGLVILAGSNDILLDRAMALFNQRHDEPLVVFGNVGSLGGIQALGRQLCHVATSHLWEEESGEYNFHTAQQELGRTPAVVNFCRREQGLILAAGNPLHIESLEDLVTRKARIVNRRPSTGTRRLFDHLLHQTGIGPEQIRGYDNEVASHLELGLQILAGKADAGPGIRAVSHLLGLHFIPWRWERFDFLIAKDRFFDPGIQSFLGFLHDEVFRRQARELEGYDLEQCGKVLFPKPVESLES